MEAARIPQIFFSELLSDTLYILVDTLNKYEERPYLADLG
jgi:hypothetical protein